MATFANPRCYRLRYRGLMLEIIFKGTVTNKTTRKLLLGPVLNNELFFANGKRLYFCEPDFSCTFLLFVLAVSRAD